jgi:hypothetical protein
MLGPLFSAVELACKRLNRMLDAPKTRVCSVVYTAAAGALLSRYRLSAGEPVDQPNGLARRLNAIKVSKFHCFWAENRRGVSEPHLYQLYPSFPKTTTLEIARRKVTDIRVVNKLRARPRGSGREI